MAKYNLLYIDDNIDISLEKYLDSFASSVTEDELEYCEFEFDPSAGYETLFFDERVLKADIIVIDDWLFENKSSNSIYGEEVKFAFRKSFPFKEVIIVTQNRSDEEYMIFPKYNSNIAEDENSVAYYNRKLSGPINESIQNVKIYRKLSKSFNSNNNWDPVIVEQLNNSLEGIDTYSTLTKSDLDKVVDIFNKLQKMIDPTP